MQSIMRICVVLWAVVAGPVVHAGDDRAEALPSCSAVPSPCPCEDALHEARIRVVLSGVRPRPQTGTVDYRSTRASVVTTPGSVSAATRTMGLVLPATAPAGATLSGRVVDDPQKYESIPALHVVRFDVPATQDAGGSLLDQLVIERADGRTQVCSQPVTIDVPANAGSSVLTVRSTAQAAALSPRIQLSWVPGAPPARSPREVPTGSLPQPGDFSTPPVALAGAVHILHGPFDGDIATTAVTIGGVPSTVVAEAPDGAYVALPNGLTAGPQPMVVHERGVGVQFPIAVLTLTMGANQTHLLRGQSTPFFATLSGPERLPASAWRAGFPDGMVARDRLATLAPRFKVPTEGDGVILLRLENVTPGIVSMSPSDREVKVLVLSRKDFGGGPYTLRGTIRSRQTGGFNVNGLAIAFLAPVTGSSVVP